jgi:hypothetical protein
MAMPGVPLPLQITSLDHAQQSVLTVGSLLTVSSVLGHLLMAKCQEPHRKWKVVPGLPKAIR